MRPLHILSQPVVRLGIISAGLGLTTSSALAQSKMFVRIKDGATAAINYAYTGGSGTIQEQYLPGALSKIINISLSFIGIVFFVLLMYAGWLWMGARGDSAQIDKAKSITREVVIGLIIIFLARFISEFIFTQLGAAINP